MSNTPNTQALFGNRWLLASVLLLLPFVLQPFGNAWIRIADMSLLYVLLALGLNIVVGYAGLLDLGYVAFFAVGAYRHLPQKMPHTQGLTNLHNPLRYSNLAPAKHTRATCLLCESKHCQMVAIQMAKVATRSPKASGYQIVLAYWVYWTYALSPICYTLTHQPRGS